MPVRSSATSNARASDVPNDTSGDQIVGAHQLDLAPGQDQTNIPVGVASGRTVVGPAAFESIFTLPVLTGAFTATNTLAPMGRTKAIWVVVTTGLAFASGQPTVRLYGTRSTLAASTGATSGITLAGTYLSAAIALTTAAQTAIPTGTIYRFSSTFGSVSVGAAAQIVLGATTGFAELDRWDNFLGIEFNIAGGFTAGAMTCYLESAGL